MAGWDVAPVVKGTPTFQGVLPLRLLVGWIEAVGYIENMKRGWISLSATVVTTAAQCEPRLARLHKLAKPLIVSPFLISRPKDPLFIAGCLAHLAGDLELMRSQPSLHRGAAYFGLGHSAFLSRLLLHGKRPRWPLAYVAAVVGMAPVIKDPKLIAYAAVLASYCSVADTAGGTLFMVSDSLIALRRTHPSTLINAAIIATYGLAQYRLLGDNPA